MWWRLVFVDTLVASIVGVVFWVGVLWGVLWSIGALTRHLKARRLGPSPYSWQARKATTADTARPVGAQGSWQPFWTDLKATATKPYSDKTTLEKAYGACVLLFVAAVFPMPYEYYFSVRMGVCIALYFFAVAAYRKRSGRSGWLTAIVTLMVLYNPILPFHIGVQLVWTAINAATIYALYRAKLALDASLGASDQEVAQRR